MKPNIDFRPNTKRAVYIRGTIDQSLVDALTPRILELQQDSRDPITVYIDSIGGGTDSAELLVRLLQASDQDGSEACRIITVATGRAASAAANLLTAGDYVIVYPESIIHFHGVWYSRAEHVTLEDASFMAERLQLGNDQYAFTLAHRCIRRFLLRFVSLRKEFQRLRESHAGTEVDDLSCVYLALCEKVPRRNVLDQAYDRYTRYTALKEAVMTELAKDSSWENAKRWAETEAAILRAIIGFELRKNPDQSWRFAEQGMRQLRDDFLLLTEYLVRAPNQSLETLCRVWAPCFVSKEDLQELGRLPEKERNEKVSERLRPIIQPIWFFFVALCHVLQEGENELSASDAYWLGMVDEVIGSRLPCVRQIVENEPERPKSIARRATGSQSAALKRPAHKRLKPKTGGRAPRQRPEPASAGADASGPAPKSE